VNTPSAVGERQILPRHTNNTFTVTTSLPHASGPAPVPGLRGYPPRPAPALPPRPHEFSRPWPAPAIALATRLIPARRGARPQSGLARPPDRRRDQYDDGRRNL